MQDAAAKTLYYAEFLEKRLSLLAVDSGGKLHRARGPGLEPLLSQLARDPSALAGALVFDKIVGAAAALLLVYARTGEVWTPVASVSALSVLRQHRLPFRAQELISFIPDASGHRPCPFETLAAQKTPEELYTHLTASRPRDHRRG